MLGPSTHQRLHGLVRELRSLPAEASWIEFKVDNCNPQDIGECLSGLSNIAALEGKDHGYVVWGIRDGSQEVVGTSFRPSQAHKEREELRNWLLRLLDPQLDFEFYELSYEGKPIVVLQVPRATSQPVRFRNEAYVRVGSYRQKLNRHPQIERQLWRAFDSTAFEDRNAHEGVDGSRALSLLDYRSYFDLLKQPVPANPERTLERLKDDRIIRQDSSGLWNITNLGAMLFAKDLRMFRGLTRKAPRVIVYRGNGRRRALREQEGHKGYAAGFDTLNVYINAVLPRRETIVGSLREERALYPEIAIRELVANALIHQDFSVTGAGPMVEIFDARVEITNPGDPLVSTDRFLDKAPRSRNEVLASLMRRMGICEERGSGIDKVVFETEFHQLPPPVFRSTDGATVATLFAPKALSEMDREERVRACYLHASLRYVE